MKPVLISRREGIFPLRAIVEWDSREGNMRSDGQHKMKYWRKTPLSILKTDSNHKAAILLVRDEGLSPEEQTYRYGDKNAQAGLRSNTKWAPKEP
jgi:hypothetical protein